MYEQHNHEWVQKIFFRLNWLATELCMFMLHMELVAMACMVIKIEYRIYL